MAHYISIQQNKHEHWRICAFALWYWRRLLRVPWTARRSNQSILKKISSEYSLEGLMLKLKLQFFGHLMWRTDSGKRPWFWEKLKAGEGGDRGWWQRMWHHQLNGSEFEQTPRDSEWQGSLVCCIPWGCRVRHNVVTFRSDQFSRSVVSDSLRPHESQHARPPWPSPTPGVHSDSRPSSQWFHPAISSSVVPFSSCPQSLPASESFPMSQLFVWGGQSTGVSALASFLPKRSQGWSPLEWTGWISLQPKGLSRVFSNTTVQKHQFFSTQPSSQSNYHIHTWPQEKP